MPMVTEKRRRQLMWVTVVMAVLTTLAGIEELREYKGISEAIGVALGLLTAISAWLVASTKPKDEAQPEPQKT